MSNYGICTTDKWVTKLDPLTLGSKADAINNMSYEKAIAICQYLGNGFVPAKVAQD